MIASKLINLKFQIILEKEDFYPGEEVSGIIKCQIQERINLYNIVLKLENEEGYIITIKKDIIK